MTPRKPLFVAGAVLLITAAPALAQQKIAPTRNYNAYNNTPANRPDKNYGLPTFGTPDAALPHQKTMATRLPAAGSSATAGAGATDGSVEPDLGLAPGASAPGASPGMGATPGADIGSAAGTADQPNLDFFPKTDSASLKLPGVPSLNPARNAAASTVKAGTGEMDTPLFDTPDGAPAGGNESNGTED